MRNKPAFMFYPGDWLRDDGVQSCSFAARGIWIEILVRMWDADEPGKLEKTPEEFCRLIGCKEEEFTAAIDELERNGVTDVLRPVTEKSQQSNGKVTLINRRMYREHKARCSAALRQKQYRETHKSNADVTQKSPPPSSYSYSVSVSKEKENIKEKDLFPEEEDEKKKEEAAFLEDFEDWWEDYPNKQGKERAKQHYITWRRKGKTPEELKQALRRYLAVKRKQKSETYSNGSTFLNPLPRGDSANINDYLEATPETMTESERMEMLDEMEKHRQFLESMNPEEKRRYYEAKGKHFKRFDGGDRLCEGGGKERGAGGEELLQSPL